MAGTNALGEPSVGVVNETNLSILGISGDEEDIVFVAKKKVAEIPEFKDINKNLNVENDDVIILSSDEEVPIENNEITIIEPFERSTENGQNTRSKNCAILELVKPPVPNAFALHALMEFRKAANHPLLRRVIYDDQKLKEMTGHIMKVRIFSLRVF